MKVHYVIITDRLKSWASQNVLNLFIFNTILTLLLLLRSAGYFSPFFPLSISFIVALCLILSIILLGIRSKALFVVASLFWLFAIFLKVLRVDIWAERAAIYTFEALVIGLLVFFIERKSSDHE